MNAVHFFFRLLRILDLSRAHQLAQLGKRHAHALDKFILVRMSLPLCQSLCAEQKQPLIHEARGRPDLAERNHLLRRKSGLLLQLAPSACLRILRSVIHLSRRNLQNGLSVGIAELTHQRHHAVFVDRQNADAARMLTHLAHTRLAVGQLRLIDADRHNPSAELIILLYCFLRKIHGFTNPFI